MKTLVGFALVVPMMFAAAGDKPVKEPVYNAATVIDVRGTVTEVREVTKDNPMSGIHLMLQVGAQTLDVYVGPTEFVKIFEVNFAKADQVHVIGSKVEFEGAVVVLGKEVSLGTVTLLIRDNEGAPLWKYFLKPSVGE